MYLIIPLLRAGISDPGTRAVLGLCLLAAAVIVGVIAYERHQGMARLRQILLQEVINAEADYQRNPTPENHQKWLKAKLELDTNFGIVCVDLGELRFHQPSSTTTLGTPPAPGTLQNKPQV